MSRQVLSLATIGGLFNPSTFQSLSAGTLLGSCIWGSFVAGVIAYKNLPRQQFGNLQSKTFPVYWQFNSWTSLAMLANWLYYHPKTLSSMFDTSAISRGEVVNAWVLAGGFLANSLVNLYIITPWVSNLMFKRHRLERELGKSYTDKDAPPQLKELSSQFGAAHGVSSLFNLAYLGALLFHSAWLATYGFY